MAQSKTATKVAKTVKKEASVKVEAKTSGLSVPVYALTGAKSGTVSLSKEIFGVKVNQPLMAQAVRVFLVNQRQGTQSTKTRGEVRGSTRKIYRQKGTGRARHGAITAPIFVGGGITFGPKPRNFDLKMSKQMRRKALFSALSHKMANSQIFVVNVDDASGKTKEMGKMLKAMDLLSKKSNILFVTGDKKEAVRGIKNIGSVRVEPAHNLNTYEVLNSTSIVFAKDALPKLDTVFGDKN